MGFISCDHKAQIAASEMRSIIMISTQPSYTFSSFQNYFYRLRSLLHRSAHFSTPPTTKLRDSTPSSLPTTSPTPRPSPSASLPPEDPEVEEELLLVAELLLRKLLRRRKKLRKRLVWKMLLICSEEMMQVETIKLNKVLIKCNQIFDFSF
jgi:hypothetical protein